MLNRQQRVHPRKSYLPTKIYANMKLMTQDHLKTKYDGITHKTILRLK